MKKFLLTLTVVLGILMLFSVASASELLDACPYCGNTDWEWYSMFSEDGDDVHHQACFSCYSIFGKMELCTPIPGSATCMDAAKCVVCKGAMWATAPADPNAHSWRKTDYEWEEKGTTSEGYSEYTCVASRWCEYRCGTKQMEEVTATVHIDDLPTCTEKGRITYTASFESDWAETQTNDQLGFIPALGHTEAIDEAVEPTCTKAGLSAGTHCSVCGEVLQEQEAVPALGHRYKTEITAPTCTEEGTLSRTCTVCGYGYTRTDAPATLHWFGLWTPNADGTHSAPCKLCTHIGTAPCSVLEVTAADGETVLTVCPVCGEFGETVFEVVEGAELKSATKMVLPVGEAIIRGMASPFDGVLYAFTAAYEYSGEVIPFGTTVSVSLPLSAEQFASFDLVRVDVTPATEETDRTEVRTAVDYTFENDVLTFEADAAALYLLIAR